MVENWAFYTNQLSPIVGGSHKNSLARIIIRITCLCNVDPLTPHFYIVKLGFTGVYIIFLFLL